MHVPSTEDILKLSSDHVAEFINKHTSSKTLSVIMRQLNEQLMSADEAVRNAAQAALQRLGFPEYA
ncbi:MULTISPECIES: hypothetical protein [Paracoccaceae]|jgi:hypothetical protein|uniref:hypothetical protein n=1 Tax=Rhodobacterales TaxID=204455 RepID=UPI001B0A80A2|nr:hypothetical protein [Boseongicola sp. H5]MBO6604817.1 hypothetical protein [Roseicyclus sp.]MBO6624663.1 hypothetical protein [Roseicyclus sp.]MBO6921655.1 hypothetical protein [Roseicyclus sp.]